MSTSLASFLGEQDGDGSSEMLCLLSRYSDLRGWDLKLDDVVNDVANQVSQQAGLGVQISRLNEIPEVGPQNRGLWNQISNATAIFADLKSSTTLNTDHSPRAAAFAYTYFIRAMTVILERFGAQYIDIQGDGIFGLFSGEGSTFKAASCAITMKTEVERTVSVQFATDTKVDWQLAAGVGVDMGTLLVRRLGLRGAKENEVWAGKPVNVAAKLSSQALSNQVVVSDRVYAQYEMYSELRRRALLWSCGCGNGIIGRGLDVPLGRTVSLWKQEPAPAGLGLDFGSMFRLESSWCRVHGSEFCEAILTGAHTTS